ncbi:hypothetical protein [Mycobacterium asiaticum]|uniref:Uncharacterized protein n=1 Tax=Mycobacterium asiaticum TaxID=1790 RepID=A0A1A3J053_MYCAS|nr:hypothetical protein [Mycobacterium asiaticum]OBI85686.1 hypothetical protein A5661_12100 [Mycobacterium asiaticum]OBJ66312.1 hypothetical protein A9W94_07555 [Mycobacterium asiaticum]OBJ87166.1 hypothetical protein A5640_07770 [Mycobacterium asiaticum]ORA18867.1 hypothetical protein BST16_01620 [Mycobacterium asiaticum DSM 44297]
MDPRERIPHDDWADQDLLTKSEAAERLTAEIVEVSASLERPDGPVGAHRELLERRLSGLREAVRHLTEGAPG